MLKKINNGQRKSLLILILLVAGLLAAFYGAKSVQDRRSKAAGTYEVGMKVVPNSGSYNVGVNLKPQIKVNKIASRTIRISGIQAVLTIGDKFVLNGATCMTPFNGLPFVKIDGQTVTIFCAISTAAAPVNLTATDMGVAQLDLNVDPFATDGTTSITFNSTRITEVGVAGQAPDVSTAGSLATYTIISTPPCPRDKQGNLDCSLDGCIDTADFELFRQDFGKSVSELAVQPGNATPDLVVDNAGMIDTADYEIFRSNFGTCQ